MERTTLRYLDPITGERYHMLYNPPPTQEVQQRLSQKPSDSEENIVSFSYNKISKIIIKIIYNHFSKIYFYHVNLIAI